MPNYLSCSFLDLRNDLTCVKSQILFVAYYYAILLFAYVFVFQVLTGVLMLY